MGRLVARKGVSTLIEALALLPLKPDARVIVVGDGPERPALEALARAASDPGATSEVLTMYGRALLQNEDPAAAERVLRREAFLEALGRADLVSATGGLGPTEDDVTREAASDALGRRLVPNEQVLDHIRGRFARELLAEALPQVVLGIGFPKSMYWTSKTGARFIRPIRWLLALLGEQVVPFEYAGLRSGRVTRGLRFYEPAEFGVKDPADYFRRLKEQGILLDREERRPFVAGQAQALGVGAELERERAVGAAADAQVAGDVVLPHPGVCAVVVAFVMAPGD